MVELICGYSHLEGIQSVNLRLRLNQKGLKSTFYNRGNSYNIVLPFRNVLVVRGFSNSLHELLDESLFDYLREVGCYPLCLHLQNGVISLHHRFLLMYLIKLNLLPLLKVKIFGSIFYGQSSFLLMQLINRLILKNKKN